MKGNIYEENTRKKYTERKGMDDQKNRNSINNKWETAEKGERG